MPLINQLHKLLKRNLTPKWQRLDLFSFCLHTETQGILLQPDQDMAHQQELPSPGFSEPFVLNAQGWWKSSVLMPCQMSLLCWVLSVLWPTTSQPALPAMATALLPACNPDWLDWSSFIRGTWWWQDKCHYLRQTGNIACAERFPFVMKWQRSSEMWPAVRSCSPEGCPLLQLSLLSLICIQHMHCTWVFNTCAA